MCAKIQKKLGRICIETSEMPIEGDEQKINNSELLDNNNKNYSTSGSTSGKKPENNWIMLFGLELFQKKNVVWIRWFSI